MKALMANRYSPTVKIEAIAVVLLGCALIAIATTGRTSIHAQDVAAPPFYCLATDASGRPVNNSQRICFPLYNIDVVWPDNTQLWMRGGGTLSLTFAEWDILADFARSNGMPKFPDRPGRILQ
jgi:hypothetical protein